MSRLIKDLTGFDWEAESYFTNPQFPLPFGQFQLTESSFLGYEVLAGGVDGLRVTRPAYSYNAPTAAVWDNLARTAAMYVVDHDLQVDVDERYLLRWVDPDDMQEESVRVQLAKLHLRLFGEEVGSDSRTVDQSYDLISALYEETGDFTRTWQLYLSAAFQDFRFTHY